MAKQRRQLRRSVVLADPSKWSKESQQSYSFESTKTYADIKYSCLRCERTSVFGAEEQKHTYEVKKRYFWQRRVLCEKCWKQSNTIRKKLLQFEERWQSEKLVLEKDLVYLSEWLSTLTTLEEYVPHKPDTAKKNMLKKLIEKNA